jgi:sugar lactone lactonase YvrE
MTPTKSIQRLATALALLASSAILAAADEFPLGPDSVVQPGVPKGELIKYTFAASRIFPGTTRDVTVYVPRQYDPAKPACVFVDQDAVQFNAPVVFDNLIARGELPVIVGVFATPGVVKAADPATAQDRYNRSFEYDGLGDAYARFLLEEILPDVEKRSTSDGRPIRLSHSGNDRAIAGTSSGAIAAFTAAWERPEAFTRVLSGIGTYVGLRGGDSYPTLIRKTEPKPIRVFLQDGSNDNNLYGGDWWMANQTMERALVFAGYEVNHVWGTDGHSSRHLTAIFPDAIRWLWQGWPEPVKAGRLNDERMGRILIPGEGWQLVGEGYRGTEGTAVNARGEVFFNDVSASKTYKIGLDGKVSVVNEDSKRANGQAFDAQGRLYSVSMRDPRVLRYEPDGKVTVLAEELAGNDIVVARNGNVYLTNPPPDASNDPSKLWLIRPDGTKQVVDTGGVRYMNGVTFSPDQSLLYVADYRSHWVYSYVVQPDGTLAHKQRFFWLHVADTDDQSNADGIRTDTEGRLYVATRLGIQVCDQPGRVNAILPMPNRRVSNLVFGGEKFDTLFATCGDKVYKRKLATTGANAWGAPTKPPRPRL